MSNIQIDANKLITILQRKIGELTSANVIQEVQISSLQDSNAELVKQLADLSKSVQEQVKTAEPAQSFNTVPAEQLTEDGAVQSAPAYVDPVQ